MLEEDLEEIGDETESEFSKKLADAINEADLTNKGNYAVRKWLVSFLEKLRPENEELLSDILHAEDMEISHGLVVKSDDESILKVFHFTICDEEVSNDDCESAVEDEKAFETAYENAKTTHEVDGEPVIFRYKISKDENGYSVSVAGGGGDDGDGATEDDGATTEEDDEKTTQEPPDVTTDGSA